MSESLAASEFDGVLDVLLESAGDSGPLRRREEVSHPGATNRTWIVETERGSRYVLRVYLRLDEAGGSDRIGRETDLHRRLRRHGIPAPQVLAAVVDGRRNVALFEYLPGELLDDVTERVDSEARSHAWRAVGQVLARIHSITFPDGTAGMTLLAVAASPAPGLIGAFGFAAIALRPANRWAIVARLVLLIPILIIMFSVGQLHVFDAGIVLAPLLVVGIDWAAAHLSPTQSRTTQHDSDVHPPQEQD